jgi:Flp pilus assembly protein TadB
VIVVTALALAWGVLAAVPVLAVGSRRAAASRSHALRRSRRANRVRLRVRVPAPLERIVSGWRRDRRRRREFDALIDELPVAVDLVGCAVSAGATPALAIELAARFGPARAARHLRDVLERCAFGIGFDSSLRELADDSPALRPLADTLRTSARLGAPVAPALARLAAEVRADVRRRAEARARTIPVRLCFPLVGCVLPAFALLTVVPVVVDGLHG